MGNRVWTDSPCCLTSGEETSHPFSSEGRERSPLTHKIQFASDASGSSYWSFDGLSDGLVPVGSSGVRVGLEEELTSCVCCDLQQIKHFGAEVSMDTLINDTSADQLFRSPAREEGLDIKGHGTNVHICPEWLW